MVTSPELDRSDRPAARSAAAVRPPRPDLLQDRSTDAHRRRTGMDRARRRRPRPTGRPGAAAGGAGAAQPRTLDATSPARAAAARRHRDRRAGRPGGDLHRRRDPRSPRCSQATEADIAERRRPARPRRPRARPQRHRPVPRAPRPVVDTPRYRAMRCVFDRRGPAGRTMMYSTAGLQVCLDAGEPDQVAAALGGGARGRAAAAGGVRHRRPARRAGAPAGRPPGWPPGWPSTRPAPARSGRPAPADQDPVGRLDPVRARRAAALPAPATARTGRRRRGSPSPTGSPGRCPTRPPPTTWNTTSARSSRRSARAATWRSATSTPSPAATGSSRWRC